MQSGLPLTSGGYWTLATHQICSTFWKHSPRPPTSSSLSLPHLSALLSVANTFLLQNKLDDHFHPRGLAL